MIKNQDKIQDALQEDKALKDLSVIVPFAAHDVLWKDLLRDLISLPKGSEILLVGPEAPDEKILRRASEGLLAELRYVHSAPGRGRVLNAGAKAATKNFFWFLHADSKVPRPSVHLLNSALISKPQALHYFNLQFLADGPRLVGLNSIAANLRARYLGLPFGNQGYALSRATFLKIGGFSESSQPGEDHRFIWQARRKRVAIHNVPAAIFTSARSYEAEGWGRLTRARVLLAARQAAFESLKLLKARVVERASNGRRGPLYLKGS